MSQASQPGPSRRRRPFLPILEWGLGYDRGTLGCDALAAVIVTLMLVPQGLAYAQLAGLPPEAGLYASVVPLLLYALLGSSRVMSVGPVAVVSLMTAAAVAPLAAAGAGSPATLAMTLAFLSGLMLLAMGLLRLGFIANFLSHPVISGFITASALLIAASQFRTLVGWRGGGDGLGDVAMAWLSSPRQAAAAIHVPTLLLGALTLAFLLWARVQLQALLLRLGLGARLAAAMAKAAPALAIVVTIALSAALGWQAAGIAVVGPVPQGLPPLTWPSLDLALWRELALPALFGQPAAGRKPVLRQRPRAGRLRQRHGGQPACAAPCGAAVLGHQRHRRQRTGKPGSHRTAAGRRRHHAAPVGSERAGDGPPAAQ